MSGCTGVWSTVLKKSEDGAVPWEVLVPRGESSSKVAEGAVKHLMQHPNGEPACTSPAVPTGDYH